MKQAYSHAINFNMNIYRICIPSLKPNQVKKIQFALTCLNQELDWKDNVYCFQNIYESIAH